MSRNLLIVAMRKAAESIGYAFHTGMEEFMETDIQKLPALWLNAPKLITVAGIRNGDKIYSLRVHLLTDNIASKKKSKELILNELEHDASKMLIILGANERIRSISGIQFNTQPSSFTSRGEISVSLDLTVKMPFNYI